MSSVGGVLKSINRFLVQAKKVDKVDSVVAYYCRLHAAQVALKMRKSREDEAVAEELISWCEQHKSAIAGLSKDGRSSARGDVRAGGVRQRRC